MLSIENPPPADPQLITSPQKISSNSSGDEDSGKLVEKVDLCQSKLDVKNSNNPPSNFSIRDYVFSSRSKGIKTNWPFSQKCLQLCLDHGVKDMLPPFQSVDNLRNQPVTVENTSIDKQNIAVSDGELGKSSDCSLPVSPRKSELAAESANINSSGSEGDNKAYRVATTSQSCSDIDSVPGSKSSCLESAKMRPIKVAQAKKCSSMVKLSSTAAQSAEEDTRPSNFMVSESMASKTCPVCKNFSSSSNTTLNAHIDRCLSGESTVKWTSNCEVSKHRMKPRKTRLMVDIYTTAKHCTLEDLDRRNGTNFAFNPSFPAQEFDECADDKNEKLSLVNLDKPCEEGAVYIDANGTKLRILSKFNDAQATCSKVFRDSAPKKIMKGDKGSKFLSTKKKKHKNHAQKYHKILKSAAQSKKICTPGPHSSEMGIAQDRSFVPKQNTGKEECLANRLRSQDKVNYSESGTMRQWTCSKSTGVTRKMCSPQGNESHEQLGSSYANRTCAVRSLNSPVKPVSFQKSHKRLEDDHSKQPYLRKRVGFPPLDSQFSHGSKSSSVLQKRKAKHLNTDDTRRTFSERNLAAGVNTVPVKNVNNFTVKAKKFSSLKKDLLLNNQSFVPERTLMKSQVPRTSRSDEEAVVRGSGDDQHYDSTENWNEYQARHDEVFDRSGGKTAKVLRIRKKLQEYRKDGSSTFSFDSDSASESDDVECSEDNDETHAEDDFMELDSERNFMDFSKHSDPGTDSLAGSPKSHADTQLYGEEYERPFICLGGDQEMFSAADDGKAMIAPDMHELESGEFEGYNHLEVDPIPIPGPPGSFLPSPGRMCSEEDLQGNSSLSSSRLLSSEDHPELVDRDSSDSPVSAISTLSNFTMARSDSRSSEKSAGNPTVYAAVEENRSSLSNDSIDPGVEERCDLDDTKINVTLSKKGTRFKNDQPCCCARKEGASQGFASSYQESQVLQRQTMSSPTPSLPVSDRLPDNPSLAVDVTSVKEPSPNPQIHETKYNNTEFKVPSSQIECGSVSPSGSNPVLRLMGKNLLVVNKDPQENLMAEAKIQFSSVPGMHHSNFQSGDRQKFNLADSQSSLVSHSAQNLDVGLSGSYRSHGSYSAPQKLRTPIFSSSSFGRREPVGGYSLITEQIGAGNKLDTQTGYDPKTSSSSSAMREIIVINDGPESDATTTVSVPSDHCANLYYKPRDSPYAGTRIARTVSFTAVAPSVHLQPLTPSSSSSSTPNLGSSMYYNSGFS